MKTARILMGVFALAALVGCATNDEGQQNVPGLPSGLETSYLAINLQSADNITRVEYEDGTAAEQLISEATFYFFDAAGNPFSVNANGNYYNVAVTDNGGTQAPNIESMTDPVLVIEKYKGQFPAKVVAVVNYKGTASLSLSDLKNTLTSVGHTDGASFVMSNSVYVDAAGEVVDATALTIDNFQTTSADALANPATIYVERLVAKVSLTAGTAAFNTGVKAGEKEVYAKITGWDLISTNLESYMVKSVDATWVDTDLGFVWNDPAYNRSYWTAKCVAAAASNAFVPAEVVNADGAIEYIGEQVGVANTDRAKYVVAAQLQDADGNPMEIAQWYGYDYIGEEALLAAVAPTLKSKLMLRTGADGSYTYTNIDDSQLALVAGLAGAESYEVSFQLAEGVPTADWYSFDGTTYTAVADPNAVLAAIQPAKIYKDGVTYYYGDIKHLGAEGKSGEFGIVRNHSYKINVTGVSGWGTPVYDPTSQVENPEKPSDKESYIAAQINVLSWAIVTNDVIL
ncbi:MAG: Mfa1 fimbrilin C-terminal domain-containing protein [Alistipes sp.]|nr:Mfa1 fimbrilin C-terminal domain-containing protein [Alistipes sp.]